MARELELLTYEATMARCSNFALKLVIWWGNNIGGGTMLISENELKESADLAIAFWKKQIVLCPYINDNDKEWCKEFVETMVKRSLEKLKLVSIVERLGEFWYCKNTFRIFIQFR